MREILFRGKRVDNGEWEYGSLHLQDGETKKDGSCDVEYRILGMRGQCDYVVPETVGQYTGLTNKNGNKIFEGDIVKTDKFNTPNKRYVIKYDLLLGAFIGEDDGTMYFTTFDGDSELFEIIGNIHDNPELMKVETNA